MPLDATQAPEKRGRPLPSGTDGLKLANPVDFWAKALPGLALFLSMLLHLSLVLLPGLHQSDPAPSERGIAISLQPAPLADTPDTSAEFSPGLVEPIDVDDPPPEALPDDSRAAIEESGGAPDTESPDERPESTTRPAVVPDAARLRRQALDRARAGIESASQADEAQGLTFSTLPELPGRGGWLDEWVGPVSAEHKSWRNADGSVHSRTVLSNGRVLCTSIRAPTISELFNPSHSAAVALHRDCGRERPEPVNRNDPWLRLPPARDAG